MNRRVRTRSLLSLSLLVVAAAPAPQTAPTDYAARSAAERAEIDRKIAAGPTSPFTPIAVRMVREGEAAVVGVCAGKFKFDPATECDSRTTLRWRYSLRRRRRISIQLWRAMWWH